MAELPSLPSRLHLFVATLGLYLIFFAPVNGFSPLFLRLGGAAFLFGGIAGWIRPQKAQDRTEEAIATKNELEAEKLRQEILNISVDTQPSSHLFQGEATKILFDNSLVQALLIRAIFHSGMGAMYCYTQYLSDPNDVFKKNYSLLWDDYLFCCEYLDRSLLNERELKGLAMLDKFGKDFDITDDGDSGV